MLEAQFRAAAESLSLEPADVHVPGGEARIWYRVTPLDVSPEEIRFRTGRLGKACGVIRDRIHGTDDDLADITSDSPDKNGAGPLEVPGTYPFPPTLGGMATKAQARVWVDFVNLFDNRGDFDARKLPRQAGYEIDVLVTVPGSRRSHVEIKSSSSS